MPLLNDTTRVSVDKTVGEIQKGLAAHGANAILCEYDAKGNVVALSFNISVGPQEIAFRLPSDWPKPNTHDTSRQVIILRVEGGPVTNRVPP